MLAGVKDGLLRMRWWMFHINRTQLRRWLYKVTRPASYPYISGDGFRRLARHVYDETNQRLQPRTIREGDIVFVATDYAFRFFTEVDPGIPVHYRLITHNSDIPADKGLVSLVSRKVQVWFAQNNTHQHERVIPIPIGLENLYYYHVGVPSQYTAMRTYSGPRKNRVLAGFTIATNPGERQRVHELASQAACIDRLPKRFSQPDYVKTLVTYKFLLSPPGNGLDTHRTWEAMYLGVVPIVKDSVAMRAFAQRGLPLWILDEWEDLLSITEADLESKYDDLRDKFRAPELSMDFWRRLVQVGSVAAAPGGEPQGSPLAADGGKGRPR